MSRDRFLGSLSWDASFDQTGTRTRKEERMHGYLGGYRNHNMIPPRVSSAGSAPRIQGTKDSVHPYSRAPPDRPGPCGSGNRGRRWRSGRLRGDHTLQGAETGRLFDLGPKHPAHYGPARAAPDRDVLSRRWWDPIAPGEGTRAEGRARLSVVGGCPELHLPLEQSRCAQGVNRSSDTHSFTRDLWTATPPNSRCQAPTQRATSPPVKGEPVADLL